MSGIKTNSVKKSGPSKEIAPGNVVARIVGLSVEKVKTPRDESNPEYNVLIELETRPIGGDFEGFFKDPQNEAKGRRLGQYKRIKHGTWPIKEFSGVSKRTQKEFTISAQNQILQIFQEICEACGKPDLLPSYTQEFKTWGDLIKQLNMDLQFNKQYLKWCLGGTQTVNDKNYVVYYLNLPDKKNCPIRIAPENGPITEYDKSLHLYVKATPTATAKGGNLNAEDPDFNSEESEEAHSYGTEMSDDDLFETDGLDSDDGDDFELGEDASF